MSATENNEFRPTRVLFNGEYNSNLQVVNLIYLKNVHNKKYNKNLNK